jgi:primosomal protein N'
MQYYHILIQQKIPYTYLTYNTKKKLDVGRVVVVPLRKKEVYGIVMSEVSGDTITNEQEISSIIREFPYTFSQHQLKYLHLFVQNTFNSYQVVADSFLHPIITLAQKDTAKLAHTETFPSQTIKFTDQNKNSSIEYILDSDVVLRIKNIIRISIYALQKVQTGDLENVAATPKTILVLFPEKKYLEIVQKALKFEKDIAPYIFSYSGDQLKKSKDTIRALLDQKSRNPMVIFGTRAALFLPYITLDAIILVDEANTLHIQEQNSLYFDSREIVYLLSSVFQTQMYFVSRVPSIRLEKTYPETVQQNFLSNHTNNKQKPPTIKITGQNRKFDKHSLFSNTVLEHIRKKLDA